ncbi:MAG TPA: nickel-type superoxide dismutase maturation protease [Candidatus Limnocylindrales bacterium]|nr:nickel-type superoxide dismutase maturation protease [Candidatus Limnocylindrales bacterium]
MAVRGHSMEPALREGDWLFVLPPRASPRAGDVVLVRDPRERTRLLLKRIADVVTGGVVVLGDHGDHSTDSRVFGAIPLADVVGRAAFRYAPLRRAGPLRGA